MWQRILRSRRLWCSFYYYGIEPYTTHHYGVYLTKIDWNRTQRTTLVSVKLQLTEIVHNTRLLFITWAPFSLIQLTSAIMGWVLKHKWHINVEHVNIDYRMCHLSLENLFIRFRYCNWNVTKVIVLR